MKFPICIAQVEAFNAKGGHFPFISEITYWLGHVLKQICKGFSFALKLSLLAWAIHLPSFTDLEILGGGRIILSFVDSFEQDKHLPHLEFFIIFGAVFL